jgi:hypothetical protein
MASLLTHPIVPLAVASLAGRRIVPPWLLAIGVEASPVSARRFLSARGWQIFQSELIWAWTPLLSLALLGYFVRKRLCASH